VEFEDLEAKVDELHTAFLELLDVLGEFKSRSSGR